MKIYGGNFLVVGGAGFIGNQVARKLLEMDAKSVTVFDNFYRGSKENLNHLSGDSRLQIFDSKFADLNDESSLELATKNIDGVFHLAALWLLECKNDPKAAIEVNITGTMKLINACVRNQVKKIVFSSSASVYGDAVFPEISESHPLNNRNIYGMTKIAGEQILRSFYDTHNLDYIALRYFNVYGKNQHKDAVYTGVITKLIQAIQKGEKLTIDGDGTQSYDFIDVRDVANANILAMESDLTDRAYNVCTGRETSIINLTKMILNLSKNKTEVVYKPYQTNDGRQFVKKRIGSTKLALEELKFSPNITLEQGILDLINEYSKSIDVQ